MPLAIISCQSSSDSGSACCLDSTSSNLSAYAVLDASDAAVTLPVLELGSLGAATLTLNSANSGKWSEFGGPPASPYCGAPL
eukprot:1563974-Alexandrium_andersonii.AAC.1